MHIFGEYLHRKTMNELSELTTLKELSVRQLFTTKKFTFLLIKNNRQKQRFCHSGMADFKVRSLSRRKADWSTSFF